MITIRLNKKKYRGIYRWSELTLQKFCNLASVPMPEGYESYIAADGKFSADTIDEYIKSLSAITDKQIKEDFPAYYRKVISCLSNVPVKKLTPEQVNDLYDWYFKPFVVSLIYHKPVIHFMGQLTEYVPEQVRKFRIGLRTFYLPETVHILDQDIPLAKEPVVTYTEASDIFRGMKVSKDDVKRLSHFMAIYCRKKRERYSDRIALERQSMMMRVPMSIVWAVFFYTVRRLPDSALIILLFGKLPKQVAETVSAARTYKNLVTEHLSTNVQVMEGSAT